MDNQGQELVIAHPPPQPTTLIQLLVFYGLIPALAPVLITYKFLTVKTFRSSFFATSRNLYSLVSSATIQPIFKQWYFQDASLLQKLWKLSSARAYIDEDTQQPLLEYQVQVGYCGSATERCILRSFGLLCDTLPPQENGESKPEPWCEHITQIAKDHSENESIGLSTRIFPGSVSYDEFVSTLREGLANKNVRIACNFLRSALTGFEKVRYVPAHLIVAMFGGHFSPILGIIENGPEKVKEERCTMSIENDNPLVAIFDTNHKYNGVYFVPAKRLYDAVRAIDVFANTHRAIVLVERK